MSATNAILSNDLSITLDWADVSGATTYHAQVAQAPDFSGSLLVDDNTLAVSTKSFTDAGENDSKRWWRWRYSADGGGTWSEWSSVGHYWIKQDASADVTVSDGAWKFFDADDVTDVYSLPDYPRYTVNHGTVYREKTRNRLGDLLSEYVTAKDSLSMEYSDMLFMTRETMNAMRRFNLEVKTFFVGAKVWDGLNYVPQIWKVQFSADPQFTMLAPGREDYFTGSLEFEEV